MYAPVIFKGAKYNNVDKPAVYSTQDLWMKLK